MRQSSRMQNLNISKNRKRNWHTNCIQVHTSQTNCWMFMMCSVFFALFTLALTRAFSSLNSVLPFSTNQPLKILSTVVDQFRVSVFFCFFFLLDKKSRRQRRWSQRAFSSAHPSQTFCRLYPVTESTPQHIRDSQPQWSLFMCNSMENVAAQGLQCHM